MKNLIKHLNEISNNKLYITRYNNFLEQCVEHNSANTSDYYENHHILPRSLFPDYEQDENNIVKLTARQHYICHWMLAKIYPDKMWFAFNMMQRVTKHHGSKPSSILYEYARKYIAEQISKSNTGKKHSKEFCEKISKRFKGKIIVKDEQGKHFWTHKEDERLKDGTVVPAPTGRTHSEKTKRKMSKNGIRGKKYYKNSNGTVRLFEPTKVPSGYLPYAPHVGTTRDNMNWAWNTLTKKQERLAIEDFTPHHLHGRVKHDGHNGFAHINDSDKKQVLDLIHKCYDFLKNEDIQTHHVIFNGVKLENIDIFVYDYNVLVGATKALKYLHGKNIMISRTDLLNIETTLSKPHHNHSKEKFKFLTENEGKSASEIGILKYKLLDFEYKNEYNVIHDDN